jgi:predicted nuclease of predicted toxin-antitoxin system
VKPSALPLLADENVHPEVVTSLRAQGRGVVTVVELGLIGAADIIVLRRAHADGRVVLTHDADFGALAVHAGVGVMATRCAKRFSCFFVAKRSAAVVPSRRVMT